MITDFHSHILPDLDDGSQSVEMSLEMLAREAQQGIRRVVATPHFYLHYEDPQQFLRRRQLAFEALSPSLKADKTLPELLVGAEVYYFSGIGESEIMTRFTIGQSKCVMVEMPLGQWTDGMLRDLENMEINLGLTPVIAHIDRYLGDHRNRHLPEILEGLPVYVQANAEAFLSWPGRRRMLRMLKKEQIHILGSDCHNMQTRAPNLSDAIFVIKKNLGEASLMQIQNYEKRLLALGD